MRIVFIILLLLPAACAVAQPWRAILPLSSCGADSSMYAVHAYDRDRLFAVGEDGAAHRSTDGGTTWSPMRIADGTDLYAIAFTSALNGMACGDRGTVARTSDGGATWQTLQLPGFTQRACYSLTWIDKKIGLIAGGSSAIAHGQVAIPDGFVLRTTDAGLTWDPVITEATQFFWRVYAAPGASESGKAFATSYGPLSLGRILVSSDFGAGWREDASRMDFLPYDLDCIITHGDTVCVAGGGNPRDFDDWNWLAIRTGRTGWVMEDSFFRTRSFLWSVVLWPDASSPSGFGRTTGHQSGQLRMTRTTAFGATSVIESTVPSFCAVYDLALVPGGTSRSSLMMAAGSGHGLFVREPAIASAPSPPAASVGPELAVDIFPQPVRAGAESSAMLVLRSARTVHVRIVIVDVLGRERLSGSKDVPAGIATNYRVDCSDMSPGMYMLRADDGDRVVTRQLLVVR